MKEEKTEKNRGEEFLDAYRRLEQAVESKFDLSGSDSAIRFLEKRPEYREIRAELDYCREVRNLLTHNPRVDGDFAVEPSGKMLLLLENTAKKVLSPTRACDLMVPENKVLSKRPEDRIRPTLSEMRNHGYANIPILDDGKVIGVFSERTLLSVIDDRPEAGIGAELRFCDSEVVRYISLDSPETVSFRFVPENMPFAELEDMFAAASKKNDRIRIVFVTRSGSRGEPLRGILTAWDVAGK